MNIFCISVISALLIIPVAASEKDSKSTIAEGIASQFGSHSISRYQLKPNEFFVVQVGFLNGHNSGKLIRFEGESGKLKYCELEGGKLKTSDLAVPGEPFRKLIMSMIDSAPTAPVNLNEGSYIMQTMDGENWLFEYIDPLDNRWSIVTIENLSKIVDMPKVVIPRNHQALRTAFEAVIKSFQTTKH